MSVVMACIIGTSLGVLWFVIVIIIAKHYSRFTDYVNLPLLTITMWIGYRLGRTYGEGEVMIFAILMSLPFATVLALVITAVLHRTLRRNHSRQ